MNPRILLEHLDWLGVEVSASGEKLHLNAPKGILTPWLIEDMQKVKTGILELLQKETGCLFPVFSKTVGETVYFTENREAGGDAPKGAVVYDLEELRALLKVKPDRDALKAIHAAKKTFEGKIAHKASGENLVQAWRKR